MKNDITFVRMRSSDHLGDAKGLASSNLTFLQIAINENGFRRNERRADLQKGVHASNFA